MSQLLRFPKVRDELIVCAPDETPLAVIAVPHDRRNSRLLATIVRSRMCIRFGVQWSQACGGVLCPPLGLRGYSNTVVARRPAAGKSSPAACGSLLTKSGWR